MQTPATHNRTRIRQSTWLLIFSLVLFLETGSAIAGYAHSDACVDAIGLCTIVDGRKHETIITSDQFDRAQPLVTQGYISEIKLYCSHQDISAKVVDEPIDLDRLTVTRKVPPPDRKKGNQPSRTQVEIAPKIPGDCIGLKDEVTVAVSNPQGDAFDLKIRQTGYRTVHEVSSERLTRSQPLVFRYLGSDAAQFNTPAALYRFQALSEGIRKIEQAYGLDLVQSINIIDLKGYNNALSLKGKNEIWLYADTFWSYESGELRSMASHETLHIFVDHCEFTEKPAVRELFADLMGFDARSKERFALLTTGHLPRGYASGYKSLSPFWGFINERHFIEGMSGGHSSDNIDEFCTSFLHSLLYSDRLEDNLRKPIAVAPRKAPRVMSPQERGRLLQLYRNTIEVFHSTALQADAGVERPSILDLCSQALHRVDSLFRQRT